MRPAAPGALPVAAARAAGAAVVAGDPPPADGRHLLHIFPSFSVGGGQVRLARIANRLGRRYRHTIVSLDGCMEAAGQLDPTLAVRLRSVLTAKSSRPSPANLARFARVLSEERPDLLLTYNFGATEWALANRLAGRRARNIHYEDGFGPEEAGGRQLARRVWFRRLALTGRTQVVVPSRTLERIAVDVWRLAPARVLRIDNGVDCERFSGASPDPALEAALDGGTAVVVGYVGALRAEKNVAGLVAAFAALPAASGSRLLIVGEGPERARLEGLAAASGLSGRVVFAGEVRRPEAAYACMDVFALASDTEQMPMSLIEAMAAGLPVVATDVGDVRRVLAAENRPHVVAARDTAAFAAQLERLAMGPGHRRRLGEANRRRALAAFDERRMVDAHEALFQGRSGPARGMDRGGHDKEALP